MAKVYRSRQEKKGRSDSQLALPGLLHPVSRWSPQSSLPPNEEGVAYKLGLEVTNKSGNLAFLSVSSVTLLLSEALGKHIKPAASSIEIVFPVESVTASYKLLEERGCKFIKVPSEVSPGTYSAVFTDPDGHMLTVLGPK